MNFTNLTYNDETITLDGNTFKRCTFNRCLFVFEGTAPTALSENVINAPRFRLGGPASRTIDFLSKLYGAGAGQLIEDIFEKIRTGNFGDTGTGSLVIDRDSDKIH